MKTVIFGLILSSLTSTVAMARPTGVGLEPVVSVTQDSNGNTLILGDMPLQGNDPGIQRQQNIAIFPSSVDTVGCTAIAQQAAQTGRYFVIEGTVSQIGATNGNFTMTFSSLQACKLY